MTDPSTPGRADRRSDLAALLALALGTFAVGTEGFMIAAILPTVAAGLRASVQAVGQWSPFSRLSMR